MIILLNKVKNTTLSLCTYCICKYLSFFTFKETNFGKMSYVTEKGLIVCTQTVPMLENILLPGYLSCGLLWDMNTTLRQMTSFKFDIGEEPQCGVQKGSLYSAFYLTFVYAVNTCECRCGSPGALLTLTRKGLNCGKSSARFYFQSPKRSCTEL